MADLRVFANTSNLMRFVLKNASTGVGLTGLSSASSGLIISTIADVEATATVYTAAGSTIETITTLGTFATPTATKCRFREVDAVNHKGLYEFQFADARFTVAGARRLIISVTGAANLLDADYEIQLVAWNPYDGVRLGLTALPNAAAEALGGLYTRGSGAGQINQNASGQVDTRTVTMGTDVVTSTALATSAVNEVRDAILSDSTPFPGARIDAAISSRLASASYIAPLDAAGTRSALGMASANLDAQLAALASYVDTEVAAILAAVDTEVAAIKLKTDTLPPSPAATGDAMTLTSGAQATQAAAVWDEVIEGLTTARQSLRLANAVLGGKLSGGGSGTETMRDLGDTKNRVVATVDAAGNRLALTRDLS